MAWDYQIVEVNGGSAITADYTAPVTLTWGKYMVYHVRFGGNVTNVTFDFSFDDLPGFQTGYAIGYLCDGITSWFGSDEVPYSFIDYFSLSTMPLEADVSDIVNCYIVTRPIDSTQSGFARLTIDIGGSGGGVRPYYTATGDSSALSIALDVSNYRDVSYSNFVYYIQSTTSSYSDSYTTASSYHTFTGLSNEEYEVWVVYTYQGSEYGIPNSNGGSTFVTTIDFGSGPSPSESWHYTQYAAQTSISTSGRTLAYNITSSGGVNEGVYCRLGFATSGTVTVTLSRTDMTVYIVSGGDYSYNTQNGAPFTYDGGEASGGTSRTFSATAGDVYYLWVRGDSSSVTGTVTVTISLGNVQWSYDNGYGDRAGISTEITQQVSLTGYTGALFRVSFSSSGTASFATSTSSAYVYVTSGNYSYNTQSGVPFAYDGTEAPGGTNITFTVSSGSYYYIWVKGVSASYTGTVTVTIGPPGSVEWIRSALAPISVTTSVVNISFNPVAGRVYVARVTFSTAGMARFYSSDGGDRYAWLMSSDRDIDAATGIPRGTPLVYDTSGGDYNFTYSVSAGTTYYFWIRADEYNDTSRIDMHFSPASATTNRGYWIKTASAWRKLTMYIRGSSTWRESKGYVGTSSGTWPEQY